MASAFFTKPVEPDCPLTGWWESYPGHKALDYGWLNADPARTQQVYAAYAGTVVSAYNGGGDNGGWGNRVVIEHAPGVRTTYNHMRTGSVLVSQGQTVATGQKIGTMGATGRVTGVHLHWELYIDGVRVDPRPYREGLPIPRVEVNALQPQQRQVRSDNEARRRQGSPSTSAPQGDPLPANTVGNFVGWVNGEDVSGNALWYVGTSGDFFWSGSFTEVSKHDLADMNTAPPASNQRTALSSAAVNQRTEPKTSAQIQKTIPAGETGTFDGWAYGDEVSGNKVWFRGALSGLWSWSGGFTDSGTAGLTDLNGVTPTPPTPPNPGVIDPAYKTFTADSELARWIGSPNYNWRDPRPADAEPTHVTMHWMDGTLAGTDAQFQKYTEAKNGVGNGSASNYGIGQDAIHQYVREQDYQQADGDQNSNRWGLSIEHEGGTNRPITPAVMAASAQLLAEIAGRWGWTEYVVYADDVAAFLGMPDDIQLRYITDFATMNPTRRLVFPHKAWASTACPGDLDYVTIVIAANKLMAPEPEPTPEPEPEPTGVALSVEFVKMTVASLRAKAVQIREQAVELEAQAAQWEKLLG